jgi:hypothetical protein
MNSSAREEAMATVGCRGADFTVALDSLLDEGNSCCTIVLLDHAMMLEFVCVIPE